MLVRRQFKPEQAPDQGNATAPIRFGGVACGLLVICEQRINFCRCLRQQEHALGGVRFLQQVEAEFVKPSKTLMPCSPIRQTMLIGRSRRAV